MRPPPTLTRYRIACAKAHLRETEPRFDRLIERVGAFRLRPTYAAPFDSLLRAIVFQAVSTLAARSIFERVLSELNERPTPAAVLAIDRERWRALGLSYAKADALHDLSSKTLSGVVPNARSARSIPDDELIARLTQIRGVGRWTVEMLLIFGLGRTDVLPVGDLGVRRGYRVAFGRRADPQPKRLAHVGEAWAPYRSVAAWYLWRATELDW